MPAQIIPPLSEDRICRFWSKVSVGAPYECWNWTAFRNRLGYGMFGVGRGATIMAHRVSWYLAHGTQPGDFYVCHHCDNPACVNPAHFFLGTVVDNNKDRARKGRSRGPEGIDCHKAKLADDDVRRMRELYRPGVFGYGRLAKQFGITKENVGMIVRRETWKHVAD